MALKKQFHLKRKRDFEKVFQKGRGISNNLFSLKVVKENSVKIGIVVSKKVSKRAVVRNKVRRRISEAIRPLLPTVRYKFHMVIVARPDIEKESFFIVREQLIRAFKKIGILW